MRRFRPKVAPNLSASRVVKSAIENNTSDVGVSKSTEPPNSELAPIIPPTCSVQVNQNDTSQISSSPETPLIAQQVASSDNVGISSATTDKENLNNSGPNESLNESHNKDIGSASADELNSVAGPSVSRFKVRSKVPPVIRSGE